MEGLKSIPLRLVNGELVVLPTDKSGRFAIMTMDKYIKAGEVHVKDDEKMGTDDLKKNKRHLNGHMIMLLKFFGAGADWSHQQRLRESMLNASLYALYGFFINATKHGPLLLENCLPPDQ